MKPSIADMEPGVWSCGEHPAKKQKRYWRYREEPSTFLPYEIQTKHFVKSAGLHEQHFSVLSFTVLEGTAATWIWWIWIPLWYLCSVPTAEAPGDAMSECSGGIQGEGPASRHKTTRDKTYNVKL